MLSREALNSALPLTDALDNARLYLRPVTGTPLEALVIATRADKNFLIPPANGSGEYTPDIANIEYIANCKDPVLKHCQHDVVMDEIAQTCIESIQGSIMFAKTKVAPAVQDLAEKTMVTMNEFKPAAMLGMEVVVWNPPLPLINSSLANAVRRFEETPYDSPALNMRLPSLPVSEISQLMKTGTSSLDNDVAAWLAEKGDTFILTMWENMFQQKQADIGAPSFKRFVDYINDRECGLDYAMAVYLIARRLVDDPIDGIEMSLPYLEALAVEFRNQAAAKLARAIDELDTAQKNGMLVREASGTTTLVNGAVYRTWIEAGGENEVLFGNLLEQPIHYTVEAINANATHLKALWNRQAALAATVESNRRFIRLKEILTRHFRQQLAESEENGDGKATALRMFEDQLAELREGEVHDLYNVCLKLVCRSRFYRTDAEAILSGIERVKKENPHIDVREAAAISVVEYVADWVGSQIQVSAL